MRTIQNYVAESAAVNIPVPEDRLLDWLLRRNRFVMNRLLDVKEKHFLFRPVPAVAKQSTINYIMRGFTI
jgi:hypothetical protein